MSNKMPNIEAQLNMVYPERSHVYVNGVDIGATQIEMRFGKVSHNEIVIRIPAERVRKTFVGANGRKTKTYQDTK